MFSISQITTLCPVVHALALYETSIIEGKEKRHNPSLKAVRGPGLFKN